MTQQIINIGTSPNDRSGDPLRTAFTKVNANFTDLYTQISGLDLNAVIPSQTSNNGKYLTTNGTTLSWSSVSSSYTLPAATTSTLGGVKVDGNTITISPTTYQISAVSQIPIQTGHSGSVLTTDGTNASWASISINSLTNGSYTLSLASNGDLLVPTSQYSTAQVFASTTNTTMCLGNSSHFIQVRGSDGALVFADYSVQTTAYPGIPGPYASDPVAASNGVAVGKPYYQSSGQVYVRLA